MEFAVFADIHGNIHALDAMLQQVKKQNINNFIFCGDIMGYFARQKEVIEHFCQLPNLYAVMGNHDQYYLSSQNDSQQRVSYVQRYGKSYLKILNRDEMRYLETLPKSIDICISGKRILIVHGCLEQCLEGRIYPDTIIDEKIYCQYDFVFFGHTHYRMCRKAGKTIFINPGSLGQPRDGKGYSYCIIDIETARHNFMTVNLKQEILVEELIQNQENVDLIRYIKSKMEGDL